MKEKLIQLFERKERYMENQTVQERRAAFFYQAFGALEMAMTISDDWEKEAELAELWDNEWKDRLEAKVYEVR